MDDLEHIDFQKSFVLNLQMVGGDFVIDMEACLLSGHPYYTPPISGEAGCWVRGKMVFKSPSDVLGLKNNAEITSSVDLDGSQDYGEIEALAVNTHGDWGISGDFGDVIVSGSSLHIQLERI